ncbi:MAG: sugar ABC transporter permease [Clostridia bacterium]|nr:sugar ABC transporter permease [Clostridia bacterium]
MNLTYETKRKLLGFTFLIPYLLGFLMFFAVPLGQTIFYSFQKIDIPNEGGMSFTPIGLKNYINLFLGTFSTIDDTHQMYRVLLDENTNMLINMPLITLLALFLALLANRQFKGRAIVRMIFFLPIILGLDVVTEMLTISTGSEMVQSGGLFAEGMVARLLRQYLAIPLTYLNPILDFVENIFSVIARSGVQTLVFLAALQSISPSMYEVARIEGATAYETFWKVTIPSIMHIVMFVVIYTIIDIFLTSQIATEVYNFGFGYSGKPGNIGVASALSVVYIINVLLVLGLTLLVFRKAVSGNGK